MEIEWILLIHNNCIFPQYGYSMEIGWIYYGFSGAIANFVVWISLFFSSESCTIKVLNYRTRTDLMDRWLERGVFDMFMLYSF